MNVKRWIKWGIALGLIAFALNYGSDTYSRIAIEKTLTSIVGLRTIIDESDIGFTNSDIEIRNLFIFNPNKFNQRRMVDISKIYIDFDFPALLEKEVHLKKLVIHLKEFTVVRLPNKETNLDYIRVIQELQKNPALVETIKEKGIDFHFDHMELRIETVIFFDISKKGKVKKKEYKLNLNQQFKDVDSIESVQRIILTEAITKTALDKALNLNLKSVIKPIHGILKGAIGITKKVLPKTSDSR